MRQTGSAVAFLLADHLGSTSTVLDFNGNVVSTQKYYPYGHTRADVSTANPPTDKLFTGHQREQDDMYYMQARFYDPVAGRFLQPDSIVPDPANPQSLNRYSYVYNNPLTYTDPSGHFPGWGDVTDAIDSGKDLVVDHKDALVRYGPLASCAVPTPVCSGAVYCAATDCSGEAQFVADTAANCWESQLCRAIAVTAGVTACSSATGTLGTAACTAGGVALLSYEDAISCAEGETGGCVNVGITVGVEVGSFGAGKALKGVVWKGLRPVAYAPEEISVGTGRNWRFAPFGSRWVRIPHYHRRVFDSKFPDKTLDFGSLDWHRPWGWLDKGPGYPHWRWW